MLLGPALSAACIIPQTDHELTELPRRPNRPPRIIPQLTSPSGPATRVGSNQLCAPYVFEVAVEDPDVDNILRWAFFIDYDTNKQKVDDDFILPTGQVQRATRARSVFNPSEAGDRARLFSPGTHVLEVVVADTDFNINREQVPHGETADGGIDPGYSDSFAWFVTVETGACP